MRRPPKPKPKIEGTSRTLYVVESERKRLEYCGPSPEWDEDFTRYTVTRRGSGAFTTLPKCGVRLQSALEAAFDFLEYEESIQ